MQLAGSLKAVGTPLPAVCACDAAQDCTGRRRACNLAEADMRASFADASLYYCRSAVADADDISETGQVHAHLSQCPITLRIRTDNARPATHLDPPALAMRRPVFMQDD